jgi:MFS family permease
MLVLLYFHKLGFAPISLAALFLLYEFCGVLTNVRGGWIGNRFGLKLTLQLGLAMQIASLLMLTRLNLQWSLASQIAFVVLAQGLSGIAKDFTKISAKSSIRELVPEDNEEGKSRLFRWVALLTGSKNTLKGAGFFLGGYLLSKFGIDWSLYGMALALATTWFLVLVLLDSRLGKTQFKAKFSSILSKSRRVNRLSLARFFLFGARDIWFTVALPIYLSDALGWGFVGVGSYLAAWVVGYGLLQAITPRLLRTQSARALPFWGGLLACVPVLIVAASYAGAASEPVLLVGLAVFAIFFAINSVTHSYLILDFANSATVSLDVGFYYMANAWGRLVGTALSGVIYQFYGLEACLGGAALMLALAAAISVKLTRDSPHLGTKALDHSC